MNRHNWKEIHETEYCPAFFRDALTDFLSFFIRISAIYRKAIRMILPRKPTRFIDLCSGRGLYAECFQIFLRRHAPGIRCTLLLTDRFPHRTGFSSEAMDISYHPERMDAADAIRELDGTFLMFSALHHFPPEELRHLLRTAQEQKKELAFFDYCTPFPLIQYPALLLLTLPLVWIATPFLRPWSFRRFFWTYPLPVIPLLILIDGLLSRVRAYTVRELREICREIPGAEAGRYLHGAGWSVVYLRCIPSPSEGETAVTGSPLSKESLSPGDPARQRPGERGQRL